MHSKRYFVLSSCALATLASRCRSGSRAVKEERCPEHRVVQKMTVRLLHAAVPASVFLNRFQALGANYHNVCARRARVPNRWKLLFHNWTAWSQTCHARTFNGVYLYSCKTVLAHASKLSFFIRFVAAFSVPTVVTCWVPNCPSRCFFERPPICLYTLEETAEGRDTRGGFQKQGTFMTSDDDETLEYKKAKMGIVFTYDLHHPSCFLCKALE